MSRSFIRNVTMGSLLMMVAMFAATASTHGQSLSNHLRAKIPFDFVVGDKKLPAGEYFIGNAETTSDVVLAISSSNDVANTLTIPVEIRTPTDTAKLIFHRYGDQYFLFQVWQVGATTGRAVSNHAVSATSSGKLVSLGTSGSREQKNR
ncbi:MAG TPA: hypothetical protein VF088_20305 [Pyrinomonadaceae bacterium]